MLWDTAGQEEFDAITKAYYRGQTLVNNLCVHDFVMPHWQWHILFAKDLQLVLCHLGMVVYTKQDVYLQVLRVTQGSFEKYCKALSKSCFWQEI